MVSGADNFECDAAHLLPQATCYKLSMPELANNGYNGILLSKNLHWSLDNFIWCFDIFDCLWIDNDWCMLPVVVVKNKRNYSINQYEGKYFKMPVASIPFLWLRYEMFILQNYVPHKRNGSHQSVIDETEKYREFLSSLQYNELLRNPRIIDDWKNNGGMGGLRWNRNRYASGAEDGMGGEIKAVLDIKKYNRSNLVLFKYKPWSQAEWIDSDLIPHDLINNYMIINENECDPEWGSKKRYRSI